MNEDFDVLSPLEKAMEDVTIDLDDSRWTARHPHYTDFSAQGSTIQECYENARINLAHYLQHKNDKIKNAAD